MSRPAVEARGLTRCFGTRTAVDALDLRVPRGAILALLGPNGAGKTTTLRMLTGLLAPTAGEATVLGRDVRREPLAVKAGVAYQPQAEALYRELTVRENVEFFLALDGVPRRERRTLAGVALESTGLEALGARRASELSGGERRRLSLACAIALRRELLILDEPTAGLDPVAREAVWALVHVLRANGVTVVVTTHHMDEADRASLVGVMLAGRLVRQGSPEELLASYPHRIVETRLEARATGCLELPGVVRASAHGDRWRLALRSDGPPSMAMLRSAGARELRDVLPRLEDVYLELAAAA